MCSNLRLSKSKSVVRGHRVPFITNLELGPREGLFGLNNGLIYNARSEGLKSSNSVWYDKVYKRGIVEIEGFHEGSADFIHEQRKSMYVAILYNDQNEFTVLTENSAGIVAMHHLRMPVLLDDDKSSLKVWLDEGRIIHLKPQLIRRA
jgi:putative SOS response-associated peptidase YedK